MLIYLSTVAAMLKPSVALRCVGKGQKYHIDKTRISMRKTCINTVHLETKIGQYIYMYIYKFSVLIFYFTDGQR